jgi:hypothetical protein
LELENSDFMEDTPPMGSVHAFTRAKFSPQGGTVLPGNPASIPWLPRVRSVALRPTLSWWFALFRFNTCYHNEKMATSVITSFGLTIRVCCHDVKRNSDTYVNCFTLLL